MRSSRWLVVVAVLSSTLVSAAAAAAHLNFRDPRRALAREDNIRVDAELGDDAITAGAPVAVTYQIENLSAATVAIADKVSDCDYDVDSQTITFSIGAEVP